MKTLKIIFLSILLPVLIVFISCTGCEKNNDDYGPEEAYVIGYDPCTVIYDTTENSWVGSQGYVVTLSEREDTVLTYNLPDTLFDFPPEFFCSPCEGAFPRSEWKTYKMMIDYEYVEEDERFFAICLDIIPLSWINSVTDRGTQIKIKNVTR